MSDKLKRVLGQCLFQTCNHLQAAKPLLRRWGMRTSQSWFRDEIAGIRTHQGKTLRLAGIAQNYLTFELFWRGAAYYEPVTTMVACELAADSETFMDVGANIGFYTLNLSAAKPGLRVISFEPNPKNFELLRENVRLNQFQQVTCEPIALSDMSGTAALYLSPSDMSASLESDFETNAGPVLKVPTATLDGYIGQRAIRGPLLIKVDVEGHEAAFFAGAQRTLAMLKPDIISEVTLHPDAIPMAYLKGLGYRFYQITDRGLLQTNELAMVIRGRFRFLNCLLSTRPTDEVAALFQRIAPRVRRIDLMQTSKLVPPELLTRYQEKKETLEVL